MIQQLRVQNSPSIPLAKSAEDPQPSDFTDWMVEEDQDQTPASPDLVGGLLPGPLPLALPQTGRGRVDMPEAQALDGRGQRHIRALPVEDLDPPPDGPLSGDPYEHAEQQMRPDLSLSDPQGMPMPQAVLTQQMVQPPEETASVTDAPKALPLPASDPAQGRPETPVEAAPDGGLGPFAQSLNPETGPTLNQPLSRNDRAQIRPGATSQGLPNAPPEVSASPNHTLLSTPEPRQQTPAAMPVTVQIFATPPPDVKAAERPAVSLPKVRQPISPDMDPPVQDLLTAQAERPQQITTPPAPSPAPPRLAIPGNLHSQFLQHAPAAIDRQVELSLAPEELGRVTFQIRHHGDSVAILLSAERGETMDMLRRHGDELMREFRQAGFTGATLDFGRWGQQQQQQSQTPANFLLPDEFADLLPLPRPTPAPLLLDDAQGLNLRL
jgi:hypothetical protein